MCQLCQIWILTFAAEINCTATFLLKYSISLIKSSTLAFAIECKDLYPALNNCLARLWNKNALNRTYTIANVLKITCFTAGSSIRGINSLVQQWDNRMLIPFKRWANGQNSSSSWQKLITLLVNEEEDCIKCWTNPLST